MCGLVVQTFKVLVYLKIWELMQLKVTDKVEYGLDFNCFPDYPDVVCVGLLVWNAQLGLPGTWHCTNELTNTKLSVLV